MPELPEVETLARALRPQLQGRRITSLRCLFPGVLRFGEGISERVANATISAVDRRAKLLLIHFADERILTVHLRMTGRLEIVEARAPRVKHTHVILGLDGDQQLRFIDPRRFGRVELHSPESLRATDFMQNLGPEALEITAERLAASFHRRSGAIKSLLMNQKLVAGVGNIYADEILHRSGIHPCLEAGKLNAAEIVDVHRAMVAILEMAIGNGGSTIRDYRTLDGSSGGYQARHAVFARQDQPCLSCGEMIRRIVVGGRGTHFCPTCQPRRSRKRFTGPLTAVQLAGAEKV